MVNEDLRPQTIMSRAAFENAIRINAAIGGSTNAIIHLTAIAGRLGVPLSLDDFDKLARPVPTLVDLMPSGRHLMEDFCYAGGLPVVMRELAEAGLLNAGQITVTGKSVGENVAGGPVLEPRRYPHHSTNLSSRRAQAPPCYAGTSAREAP